MEGILSGFIFIYFVFGVFAFLSCVITYEPVFALVFPLTIIMGVYYVCRANMNLIGSILFTTVATIFFLPFILVLYVPVLAVALLQLIWFLLCAIFKDRTI